MLKQQLTQKTNLELFQMLKEPGRRNSVLEVGTRAGTRTKNDVRRVLRDGARSRYTEPVRREAINVLSEILQRETQYREFISRGSSQTRAAADALGA